MYLADTHDDTNCADKGYTSKESGGRRSHCQEARAHRWDQKKDFGAEGKAQKAGGKLGD